MARRNKCTPQPEQPGPRPLTILARPVRRPAHMDEQLATQGRRARVSGRDAKRAARTARAHSSIPYITRALPYYEVLDEEGLALIERNADTILAEVGIEFREDPEAL